MDTTKVICELCKIEIAKPISEVIRSNKIGRALYCSLSCANKHAHQKRLKANIENYNKNPKLCQCCGMPVPYERRLTNKFCSSSCAAKTNNTTREIKREKKYCLTCHKEIARDKKFCDSVCCGAFRIKTTEEKILRGEKVDVKQLKRYVIKLRGNKCEECGWNKINPKSRNCTVQLEHVDGNAENDSLDNLKLLCPNCHSLTPTFGNLNRGKGRAWRYKKRISTPLTISAVDEGGFNPRQVHHAGLAGATKLR
jgi:hypothetical protein